ncbi:MAG: response regulator [Bacteroidota bacterium]
MQSARILIVEDEFITLDALRDALTDMGYHISGDAMTAEEAIAVLEAGATDLAILDIHLRNSKSGIWIGQQIQERFHIPFIYLTAYGDKGTIAAAAEVQPASYLVKPFSTPDLHAAIELAMHQRPKSTTSSKRLTLEDSIFVKDELMFRRLVIGEILFVQSFRNYLEIQTVQQKFIIRSTLQDFAAQVPATVFVSAHRSYLVNLKKVDGIGGNFIKLASFEVPLSRNERPKVLELLATFG